MTKDEKIEELRLALEETIYMAIRYADGRSTYAPSMVRSAVKRIKSVFPKWLPRKDDVIKEPKAEDLKGISFKEDYLYDLF